MLRGSWCPRAPRHPQPCSAPCSLTLELHKHITKDGGFWGDTGDADRDAGPQSQALELPAAKIISPRQDPGQQVPRDVSATEMRLVHLDLKGAAPRVSYLEQVRMPRDREEVPGRDAPRGQRQSKAQPGQGRPCRLSPPAPIPAGHQQSATHPSCISIIL